MNILSFSGFLVKLLFWKSISHLPFLQSIQGQQQGSPLQAITTQQQQVQLLQTLQGLSPQTLQGLQQGLSSQSTLIQPSQQQPIQLQR